MDGMTDKPDKSSLYEPEETFTLDWAFAREQILEGVKLFFAPLRGDFSGLYNAMFGPLPDEPKSERARQTNTKDQD
jgi:hypothetical protein